jgi:hypothetical protein
VHSGQGHGRSFCLNLADPRAINDVATETHYNYGERAEPAGERRVAAGHRACGRLRLLGAQEPGAIPPVREGLMSPRSTPTRGLPALLLIQEGDPEVPNERRQHRRRG